MVAALKLLPKLVFCANAASLSRWAWAESRRAMKSRRCVVAVTALAGSMVACAAPQAPEDRVVLRVGVSSEQALPVVAAPHAPGSPAIAQPVGSPVEDTTDIAATAQPPREIRTRHATYARADFGELPGWEQDDVLAGWPAFISSCAVLQRRDVWRDVCAQSVAVARTPAAIRAFFESRFALLRILNTDDSRDGDISGYFEPLLEGRRQRQGEFNVPVLGVPRDLYTLDWITVPAAQRRGIVHVKPQGINLVVAPAAEPGGAALDLGRFGLDTKDRYLRVRLTREGGMLRAEPYPTRGELAALGMPAGVDAPVLAWVNDALALYAMQIQGSGRIRMPDSTVLRLNYANQNGHPFKPLRVVARTSEKVVTRGVGSVSSNEVDQFMLEDEVTVEAVPERTGTADAAPDAAVMRGISTKRAAAVSSGQDQNAAVNALVEELLRVRPKRPSAPTMPKPAATVPLAPPAAGLSSGHATATSTAVRPAFEPSRLYSDPSYVFFKNSADQTSIQGPPGALGVPLTPGRSVAVDPRVTPLGYPVFLSAPAPQGSNIEVHRLVFAQDTGGAIRGAVRADFFWGFGSDAGRLARGTRHRGQMWLLMPKVEVTRLGRTGVVTRSIAPAPLGGNECLIADDAFCLETVQP